MLRKDLASMILDVYGMYILLRKKKWEKKSFSDCNVDVSVSI